MHVSQVRFQCVSALCCVTVGSGSQDSQTTGAMGTREERTALASSTRDCGMISSVKISSATSARKPSSIREYPSTVSLCLFVCLFVLSVKFSRCMFVVLFLVIDVLFAKMRLVIYKQCRFLQQKLQDYSTRCGRRRNRGGMVESEAV